MDQPKVKLAGKYRALANLKCLINNDYSFVCVSISHTVFEFQINNIWDVLKIICCLFEIQFYLGTLYCLLLSPLNLAALIK